jgi:predicted alpha/beta superfamily hydrolase
MPHLLLGFLFTLFVLTAGCTSSPRTKTATPPPATPVTLDSSEIFHIYSATNKQNYRIRARLPASYVTHPEKDYPVVIKLDGQWDFLLAASAYNCVYFDGQMPEVVMVGIDWGDIEGDVHAIRARDLLPQSIGPLDSGQAAIFVKAIVDDIIPELERRYRLDGQRFLLGGSWSGVFATYALLENPSAFDGAIAIGPSYEIGMEAMLQQIAAASHSQAFKGKRLYIGIGKWDPVMPSASAYAKALKEAQVPGLEFTLDEVAGFGHSGMNIPGYARGYQHLFNRPRLSLAADKLRAVEGVYKAEDSDNQIRVSALDQQLVVEFPDGGSYQLWAQSETAFYHPGVFYNLNFHGEVASVETFFGKSQYVRVSP